MGFVLALGTAYAEAGTTMTAAIKADSFINTLDPSKVPGYVELETGSVTLAPAASLAAQGSAAGGIRAAYDTFPNYIDPSKVAGYVDLETGVVSTGPRTFTFRNGMNLEPYVDLSREPGFVNHE